MIVNIITDEDLKEHIKSNSEMDRIIVVDFQKSHCKPCRKVAPLLKDLCAQYEGDDVSFCKVDADAGSEDGKQALACLKENGIRTVPTFHIYVGSTRIDSIQGAYIEQLQEIIDRERSVITKRQGDD